MHAAGADWTVDNAKHYASELIKRRWGDPYDASSQLHHLMGELSLLAIEDTFAVNGCHEVLLAKLNQIAEILRRIQAATRYRYWTNDRCNDDNRWSDAERELIIWHRRNVTAILEDGYQHQDYFFLRHEFQDRSSILTQIAADYLSEKWMRHPVVDWIIVDAIITGETIHIGEMYKKYDLVGPRDQRGVRGLSDWINSHAKYQSTKGNLSKMMELSFHERFIKWAKETLFHPVVPVVVIYVLWAYDHLPRENAITLGLVYVACYLAVKIAKYFGIRIARDDPAQEMAKSKEQAGYARWLALRDIWLLLEPPVINPTNLMTAIESARSKGVVIEQAALSIIQDRLATDPALWIVQERAWTPCILTKGHD